MPDISAKLIPLSKHIIDLDFNPKIHLLDRQEMHIDIITEEMVILSQDLGDDMVIFTIIPEE